MVPVVPPDRLHPVDLGQLLGSARQQPTAPSLSCQHQGCPVAGARGIPSHLVPTAGQVLVQHMPRLQQAPNWPTALEAVRERGRARGRAWGRGVVVL